MPRFSALAKTQFQLKKTGKTRTISVEFGAPFILPEVEIVTINRVSEIDAFDGVSEVESEPGHFYLVEPDYFYDSEAVGGRATVLVREVHSYDAGDNLVRTREAPLSSSGICAPVIPRTNVNLSKVEGEPIFAVKPKRTKAQEAARRAKEEADRTFTVLYEVSRPSPFKIERRGDGKFFETSGWGKTLRSEVTPESRAWDTRSTSDLIQIYATTFGNRETAVEFVKVALGRDVQ